MTMKNLMMLSLEPLMRMIYRRILQAKLNAKRYHIAHIISVRENDFKAERELKTDCTNLELEIIDLENNSRYSIKSC